MSDNFLGEIRLFSFKFAPAGWALCQGQTLTIQQNQALYALLGVQYGGDGKTTFNLPDLRSRVPLCSGQSPVSGTVYGAGVKSVGGTEAVSLTTQQMPAHSHALYGMSAQGSQALPTDGIMSSVKPGTTTAAPPIYSTYTSQSTLKAINPGTVSSVGGGTHSNLQPFLTLNFCIALSGIWPQRS